MSVYLIADTHLHDDGIMKFKQRKFADITEHNEYLVDRWNSVVKKKHDVVFHLGDACMGKDPANLAIFDRCQGRKVLIKGNHDVFPILYYLHYFTNIHGLLSYKEFWLSHAPIHPKEMYKRKANIHGHCHYEHKAQYGDKYINVNCDGGLIEDFKPISLETVREILLNREM